MALPHRQIVFALALVAALATLLAPQAWSVRAAPQATPTRLYMPFVRQPIGNRLLFQQPFAKVNPCPQTVITNVTDTLNSALPGPACPTFSNEAAWSPDGNYIA